MEIAEGLALAAGAIGDGAPGPYAIQAAIAAEQCTRETSRRPDWARIAQLYLRCCSHIQSTPIDPPLNHAVAIAMARGMSQDFRPLIEELETSARGERLLMWAGEGGSAGPDGKLHRCGGRVSPRAGSGEQQSRPPLPRAPVEGGAKIIIR